MPLRTSIKEDVKISKKEALEYLLQTLSLPQWESIARLLGDDKYPLSLQDKRRLLLDIQELSNEE